MNKRKHNVNIRFTAEIKLMILWLGFFNRNNNVTDLFKALLGNSSINAPPYANATTGRML
jgi:hypothetical protein